MEVIEHVTIEGDRWDLLAWRYYGDPLAYEPIVTANATVPLYPLFPGGVRLYIPILDRAEVTRTDEDLPPWLR